MPNYEGLILTVGMQAEPVAYSITQCQARRVAFICTPESERKSLAAVVEQAGLSAADWRKYVVADEPSQIGRLCLEIHQAYRWLCETGASSTQAQSIAADPTAGRKWMSAGATMIAAFLGLPMLYVDAKYPNGILDRDSMRLVTLGNAYDQTGFIEADTGRRYFNQYDFAAAAEIFGKIRPTVSAQADLYAGLAALSRALDRWDRFEHYVLSLSADFGLAIVHLQRYLGSVTDGIAPLSEFTNRVAALADAIEKLPRGDALSNCGFTVDVFMNALRRMKQQRHDDACSRLYRTLESLSQLLLKREFQLDTAAPDFSRLMPEQRAKIEEYCQTLPSEISLDNGYRILCALGNTAAAEIIKPTKKGLSNTFAGLLEDRIPELPPLFASDRATDEVR